METVHLGTSVLDLDIPGNNLAFNLSTNEIKYPEDEAAVVRESLFHPVGSPRLKDMVSPHDSIVIIADDRTRVTPQDRIIPIVLEELQKAGIKNDQIKIIIAYGTHRAMTEDEILEKFGPELISTVEILGHDCLDKNNLLDKGKTSLGTRIMINKEVLDADIRIAIGSVVPHHPTGWSGGAKMLLPGVAGEETTGAMHLLGANEQQLGKVQTPCRREMEDFAQAVGLHFIVNVIHDENGNVIKSAAGHFIEAHRKAVKWGFEIFGATFQESADITLSSTHPVGYDLTQSDKGLFSAEVATKMGGEILLLSRCEEGIAPTHGEEMVRLAGYDDATLWAMLEEGKIKDPLSVSEIMYLNHIKNNFKATLMMDPMLANLMGFHYLRGEDLPDYLRYRLKLDNTLKIGIINQSTEVLPVPVTGT